MFCKSEIRMGFRSYYTVTFNDFGTEDVVKVLVKVRPNKSL